MKFKKGDNIILTCGECSDYSILDGLVALVDFDTDVVTNLFLDAHLEQADASNFETDDFEDWLVSHYVVRRRADIEWHISIYGETTAKLSPKHQMYLNKCVKERQDKADADYAAHPENYIFTRAVDDIRVTDGPKLETKDESSRPTKATQTT